MAEKIERTDGEAMIAELAEFAIRDGKNVHRTTDTWTPLAESWIELRNYVWTLEAKVREFEQAAGYNNYAQGA